MNLMKIQTLMISLARLYLNYLVKKNYWFLKLLKKNIKLFISFKILY